MAVATKIALRPILVVEDTDDDLVLLQRLLRRAGIDNPTIVVHSGTEAIALLRQIEEPNAIGVEPHVVLTDLKMPGISGLELTAWMRKHAKFARTRVVMLSSSSLPSDIAKAKAVGVDMFFMKFPSPKELRSALDE
jgi:CheY-like chemotaxis protein